MNTIDNSHGTATQHLKKRPSAILSFMPVVLLVVMLTFTIRFFGADSLSGASQTTLLQYRHSACS